MKGPYVFTIIFVYHSILRPPKAEGRFCTYLAEIKRYLARRRLAQSARLARLLTCMSVCFFSSSSISSTVSIWPLRRT